MAADEDADLIDTLIYARTTCNDSTTEVLCDLDDGAGDAAAYRLLNAPLGRYFVFVDGDMTNGGTYTGDVAGEIAVLLPAGAACDPAIPRDRCAPELECLAGTCQPLTCVPTETLTGALNYNRVGSTTGGGADHAGTCGEGNDGGVRAPDVVYGLQLPAAVTNVHVSTSNGLTDYDTLVYMRAGCTGAEVGCDDDAGSMNYASTFDTGPLAAGTYQIFVDGFATRSGNYELTVDITP